MAASRCGYTINGILTIRHHSLFTPRHKYLEDHELRVIHKVASPLIQSIMVLTYLTGLRNRDLIKIKRSDLTD